MKQVVILIVFLLGAGSLMPDPPCPPHGNAKTLKEKSLNVLKNRSVSPIPDPLYVSSADILTPGFDTARFRNTDYISTQAYLVDIVEGGSESCNCGSNKESEHTTYLYFGRSPASVGLAPKSECFVVAIHPAYKLQYVSAGRGKPKFFTGEKYYIEGYLLFNYLQAPSARNTCAGCVPLRATAWEVSPVCKINPV